MKSKKGEGGKTGLDAARVSTLLAVSDSNMHDWGLITWVTENKTGVLGTLPHASHIKGVHMRSSFLIMVIRALSGPLGSLVMLVSVVGNDFFIFIVMC